MAAPRQLRLQLLSGEVQLVELTSSRTIIGRTRGDVCIQDVGVQDPHLELWLVGTHYFIKPIGPVAVDGTPLQAKAPLAVGQIITVGSTTLELLAPAEPAARAGFPAGRTFASLAVLGILGGGGFLYLQPGARTALVERLPMPGAKKAAPAGPRSASPRFAWVRQVDGRRLGGVSELHLTFSPGESHGMTIAFKETAAGGTGSQWRASAWLAAFNAVRATGKFDEPLSFAIQADGDVDGPSASMLMSVAFIALLRGDALVPAHIISATVNPDGTAGPVGGLNEKILAAQSRGFVKFGVSTNTEALPVRTGIEVVPIANIADAYALMTGVQLPRPPAVDLEEMSLPPPLEKKLLALADGLNEASEKRATAIEKEAQVGPGVEMLYELSDECRNMISASRKHKALGFPSAAYSHALTATAKCAMGEEVLKAYRQARSGQLSLILHGGDMKRVVANELGTLARDLDAVSAKTLDQQLLQLDTYGQLSVIAAMNSQSAAIRKARENELTAFAYNRMCRTVESVGARCVTQEGIEAALVLRTNYVGVLSLIDATRALGVGAVEAVEASASASAVAPLPDAELDALSRSYTVGARAVMAYFDSVFTDELAKALGVSRGMAQGRVAGADMSYLVANAALGMADDTDTSARARLAAASTAYLLGAALVNRHIATADTLVRDPKTADERLGRELDGARAAALEAAGRAKAALGFVPLSSRAAFLEARGLATGSRAERHQALTAYWTSAVWSDLAASLKRAGPTAPP